LAADVMRERHPKQRALLRGYGRFRRAGWPNNISGRKELIVEMGLDERSIEPASRSERRRSEEFLRRRSRQRIEIVNHVRLIREPARNRGISP
jgi:hypothetical protein